MEKRSEFRTNSMKSVWIMLEILSLLAEKAVLFPYPYITAPLMSPLQIYLVKIKWNNKLTGT